MSTHVSACVLCGKPCFCSGDEYAFGFGDSGCTQDGIKIEFCSEACFIDVGVRWAGRMEVAEEFFPGLRERFEAQRRATARKAPEAGA